MMDGRAQAEYEKSLVIKRLFAVWRSNPNLRLGQLIENAVTPVAQYYIEDFPFIEAIERYYARISK
jgi:hypothetical protein